MEFRMLGPLEVVDGETPVKLAAGRQRALLADLLLHANRAVPVERLVDDLWGEAVPPTAVKAVQVYVSKLRKALPDDRLSTRGAGYQLEVAEGELDLQRFEQLHAAGRAALHEGRADDAARDLSAALSLWRGPALAEFEEPFARSEAPRLQEGRLACVEDRIDADLALGRHQALVGELEALVARHPLRERLREQLMLALYRSGRHAEALAAYQAFRRTLGDELGIDPSPRLRALETQMLRQDSALEPEELVPPRARPAARPPAVRADADSRQVEGLRPVGRDPELAHLHRVLAEAVAGGRRVVFVTGEPGVGKTTLVEAFLEEAHSAQAILVGRGQCVEHRGSGEPYLPLLEAVARVARGEGGEPIVAILRERAPTWLVQLPWLVDEAELAALQPRVLGTTRERMLRELAEALDAIAELGPLVLVLEDLHWSDVSTLDLIDATARRFEPARLLLIGTFRPTEAGTGPAPLRALAQSLRVRNLCHEIALGSLSAEAVRAYVARRLGGADLGDEVAALLRERTRGNPLFMEKLVDAWIDTGALRATDDGWELAATLDELGHGVPETLRQLLDQRFELLDAVDRSLLGAASVVGTEFAAALAATGAEIPQSEAEERLAALARDGLFVAAHGEEEWPDGTLSTRYAFVHDLCQEVLADAIPVGLRAQLHRRVGTRLIEAYGDHDGQVAPTLAWHFLQGRDADRAIDQLRVAATQALDRRAPREALAHLHAALETLPSVRDDARPRHELSVLLLVGRAAVETEGWMSTRAEEALERARDVAGSLGAAELALALHRLATLYEVRGDYARSEALLGESLRLPDEAVQPTSRVDANELMACSLFHQGDFAGAIDHAESALTFYDGVYANHVTAAFGENPGVSCHGWAAMSSWYLGRPDRAADRAASAVAASTSSTRVHARALAQAHAAAVAQANGDVGQTRVWAEAAIEAAADRGFDYWRAMATVLHGWAVAVGGEVESGLAEIEEGIARSRALGARMDDAYYLGLLADAAARCGLVDRALAAVDEAIGGLDPERPFFYGPELHRLRGVLLAERGARDEAEQSLALALREARRISSPSLILRAATSIARLTGASEDGVVVAEALLGLPRAIDTEDARDARATLRELGISETRPEPVRPRSERSQGRGPIRYARSGDLMIAYQVTGEGSRDIVLVPGFVSHLEKDWDDPRHAQFLERLASLGRLIRFDKRGTGLSDRPPGLPDLEARMDDLRAVMDDAGSERAVIFGYSEGGPLSVMFAASYPERVERLVLYGAWMKRVDPDEDYPWAPNRDERSAWIERLTDEWGLESSLETMCPSADEAMARWWGERARAAASPGAVRALMEMNTGVDVRDLLPVIQAPTLVLHRVDDRDVLVAEGRYTADRIPGARFVELPGIDHFVAVDPDQILDVVEPFVRGAADGAAPLPSAPDALDRVLATILVTDVVGSTELAARLGDRAWADLLVQHHALVREELARFRGEEIDTAGDGFLVLFDGPARAIRCAEAITRRVRSLGLGVRTGVHTGEVERVDGEVRGIAVHLAARVAGEGRAGQVVVSATTRDLVSGSGLRFADLGERELKGFADPRRLFALAR